MTISPIHRAALPLRQSRRHQELHPQGRQAPKDTPAAHSQIHIPTQRSPAVPWMPWLAPPRGGRPSSRFKPTCVTPLCREDSGQRPGPSACGARGTPREAPLVPYPLGGCASGATQRWAIWISRAPQRFVRREGPGACSGSPQAPGAPRAPTPPARVPDRGGRAAAPLGLSPRTVRRCRDDRLSFATHSM